MDNTYFYDDRYYTLEEINEKYQKVSEGQKKLFRDTLAHFTLAGILVYGHYDERYIDSILKLARIEAAIIDLYGSDCGVVSLALKGQYERELRRLINLTGKLVSENDNRIQEFKNGEWLLNKIICLTIGSSYEKEIIGDLFLVNYDLLSDDECLAIADNFVRNMKGEEIVFYNESKHLKE